MILPQGILRRLMSCNKRIRQSQLHLMTIRQASSQPDQENDKPIPFLQSPASDYSARNYRETLGRTNRPESEPLIVTVSLASLLIYFCILREENDLDIQMSTSLYDRIPGLELDTLRHKKKVGGVAFTIEDQKRLEELEKQIAGL